MTGEATTDLDEDERTAILETMRELGQVTLRAGTREELEGRVCEAFVASELYVFAWIGTEDPETSRVVPRASAGVEEDYLSAIDITIGSDETGRGPTGLAFETGELRVIQNIAEDPEYAPWRGEALERGYRSSAAIPLVYEDELYGVLNLYAPRPQAFEPYERALLVELGRDVGFAIDVLETRAALDRSRDFLARTEELAAAGGWEYDPSNDEVRWTDGARRIHGAPPDRSPTLEDVVEGYHPADRPALEAAIQGAVTANTPFDLTLRRDVDTGDDPRWVRVIGRPTDDPDGSSLIRGALQDVTERKEFEDRLATRNEQLMILNRIVRHDIRNDMTVILGWGDELSDHVDDEGEAMLERILDTGRHVVDLTFALRDFVQTLGVEGPHDLAAVDLGEVLSDELDKRRSVYPRATFEMDGTIPDAWVWADELLSSVFRNVLDNAVIHNDKPNPHVEVSFEQHGRTIGVRIADNGPGIRDGSRDAIMGRTEEGLDHPEAGLGLYLVDSLVTNYGGEVRIEDNEPEGTVFVVELAVASDGTVDSPEAAGGGDDGGR